jgi:hypothetical protein
MDLQRKICKERSAKKDLDNVTPKELKALKIMLECSDAQLVTVIASGILVEVQYEVQYNGRAIS